MAIDTYFEYILTSPTLPDFGGRKCGYNKNDRT